MCPLASIPFHQIRFSYHHLSTTIAITTVETRPTQQELAATLINKFGTPDEKLVPVKALYALWSISKLLVELLPQRSAAGTSVLQ